MSVVRCFSQRFSLPGVFNILSGSVEVMSETIAHRQTLFQQGEYRTLDPHYTLLQRSSHSQHKAFSPHTAGRGARDALSPGIQTVHPQVRQTARFIAGVNIPHMEGLCRRSIYTMCPCGEVTDSQRIWQHEKKHPDHAQMYK